MGSCRLTSACCGRSNTGQTIGFLPLRGGGARSWGTRRRIVIEYVGNLWDENESGEVERQTNEASSSEMPARNPPDWLRRLVARPQWKWWKSQWEVIPQPLHCNKQLFWNRTDPIPMWDHYSEYSQIVCWTSDHKQSRIQHTELVVNTRPSLLVDERWCSKSINSERKSHYRANSGSHYYSTYRWQHELVISMTSG